MTTRSKGGPGRAEPRGNGGTITTSVYERLRHDLLEGLLAPLQKLRIAELRERYQVGASPIREALNRLSAEGVIEHQDQRGFRVPALDIEDLHQLTYTRALVNEIAVRESLTRGDAAWEERVLLSYHRLSRTPMRGSSGPNLINPEWDRLHRDFHSAIVEGCGSVWLTDFSNMLFDRTLRYRHLSARSGDEAVRDVDAEHKAIMEAVVQRDVAGAIRLLNEHISRTSKFAADAAHMDDDDASRSRESPIAAGGSPTSAKTRTD